MWPSRTPYVSVEHGGHFALMSNLHLIGQAIMAHCTDQGEKVLVLDLGEPPFQNFSAPEVGYLRKK